MADQDELRQRRDAEGTSLPDALAAHGVELDRALEARKQLEHAAAYLELHIEQGPVLESLDLPLGVVLGTFGVERHQASRARPGRARRLDADGQAPRRAGRRGQARARDPRDRKAHGGGRRLHDGRRRHEARDRHLGRRDRGAPARPAAPRCGEARGDAQQRGGSISSLRAGRGRRGRVGADLEHRADPLRRGADRACRRGDPRGRGRVAPAAERPAARRGRGRARRASRR